MRVERGRLGTWGGLLLIASALALRLTAIGRESMWFDEAVSYLTARLSLTDILTNAVQSSHPPLYYLLLHFWLCLLPRAEVTARLLGVLWNLALVPIVYKLSRELFVERRVAWCAALMIVVSPFQILYSHEVRMYTQVMSLAGAGALAYLRAIRSGDWRWWATFCLLSVAAVYTHVFAALALMAVGLHALLGRRRRALLMTVLIGAGVAASLLPWLYELTREAHKELGSLRPLAQASELNPIKPLAALSFLLFGPSSNPYYSAPSLFLTLAGLIVLPLEARKARPGGLLLPALVVACVIGLPTAFYLIHPFFLPERTMAVAAPFITIMAAWGTTRLRSPLPYLLAAALLLMGWGSWHYLSDGHVKPPYREAMWVVAQGRKAGDIVVHTSDGSYLPALCYVNWPDHVLLAGDPDPRKPPAVYRLLGGEVWSREQVSAAGERVWLVVALEHSWDWQRAQVRYFTTHYEVLSVYDIGKIKVYLLSRAASTRAQETFLPKRVVCGINASLSGEFAGHPCCSRRLCLDLSTPGRSQSREQTHRKEVRRRDAQLRSGADPPS